MTEALYHCSVYQLENRSKFAFVREDLGAVVQIAIEAVAASARFPPGGLAPGCRSTTGAATGRGEATPLGPWSTLLAVPRDGRAPRLDALFQEAALITFHTAWRSPTCDPRHGGEPGAARRPQGVAEPVFERGSRVRPGAG